MGFFGHDDTNERQAYEQFQSTPPRAKHEGAFSHELIAGAASFEAMRAYEKHEQQNGKPENFMLAKELIAGFAGAEVDKLIETKGLNEIDALRAKHEAKENAAHALAQSQQYGNVPYSREIYGGVQGDYGNQEYGGQPGYGGPPGPGGGYGPPGGFGGPGGGYTGQGQGYGEGGVGYGPPGGGYEGQGGGGYGPPGGRYGGPPQGGYGGPPGGGYGGQGGGGPPGPGGGYGPEGGFGGPGGGFPGQGEGHHHRHHERREEY